MAKIFSVVLLILTLTAGAAQAAGVEVEELARATSSWNGVSLPDFGAAETEVTVLRITVPPGTRLPVHIHPVINVAYMLSGELSVVAASGEKKVIRQGEALVELVDQKHYGLNESSQPAELVVVYFGAQGRPITVKEE